ncbi:Hypothetical protein NocV09_01901030 [Nannochloropsis oceanica]
MVANVAMQEQEETTKVTSRAKEVTTAHRRAVFATTAGALTSSWLLSSSSSSSPNKGQAATLPTAASPTTPVVKGNGVCNDAISHLRNPKTGQDIYMIGTAHISNESAILVRSTIRALRPQTVMLELDASRIGREGKKGFLKAALGELTRAGSNFREKLIGVGAVVVGQVISGLYRGLDKMGFVSGQEFIVAMEEGRKVGADLLLGDQNVQVTLRRLSDALSKSELVKVREMESPTRSPAARELEARGIKMGGNDKAELAVAVEALKERASVRALMSTLQSELPEVYKAMIEERDAYMSASLLGCKSKVIVGVVGIGHLDGIERNLGREGFVSVPCRLAQGQ